MQNHIVLSISKFLKLTRTLGTITWEKKLKVELGKLLQLFPHQMIWSMSSKFEANNSKQNQLKIKIESLRNTQPLCEDIKFGVVTVWYHSLVPRLAGRLDSRCLLLHKRIMKHINAGREIWSSSSGYKDKAIQWKNLFN